MSGFGRLNTDKMDVNVLLSSLLLLPAPTHVLDISWSLSLELLFYAAFLIAMLAGRRIASRLWWAWLVVVLCAGLGLLRLTDPFLRFIFSPYVADFLLGTLAAYAYSRVGHRAGVVMLALGILGVAVGVDRFVFLDELGRGPRCFYWGLVFTLVMLGGLVLARARAVKFPRFILNLGDASYSIYLVHNSVQFFIMALAAKLWGMPAYPAVWIWPLAALSLTAGLTYYHLVEIPLSKRTNAWIDARYPRKRINA